MEVKVYSQEGREVKALKVSERLFGSPWKPQFVHQVWLMEEAGRRRGTAHTKDRSEVSGGGRKPWRQKGKGRARHGSIRSPLWIGGGVTHGPRTAKVYARKINKKARRKALLTVLAQKLRYREILFLEDLKVPEAKTKKGLEILKKLSKISGFEKVDPKASTLVVLPRKDEAVWRAFRNIGHISLSEARNLNIADLLSHKFLIFPEEVHRVLEETFLR